MTKYSINKIYTDPYDNHYFTLNIYFGDCTTLTNFGKFPTYESAKGFADFSLGKLDYLFNEVLSKEADNRCSRE